MTKKRTNVAHSGRLAATLLALSACIGLTAALDSLDSQAHRVRSATRHWVAVPRLAQNFNATPLVSISLGGAAALALLLLWGLHIRAQFSSEACGLEASSATDYARPTPRIAWIRAIHRGGLYGP